VLARLRTSIHGEDEGFTLIELLVVIIIIGILAAIAIPMFLNQRKKGYDAQAKSDLRNAALLQETYFTDNDTYATYAQLVASGFKPSPDSGGASAVVRWRDAAKAATAIQAAATGGFVICVTASSGSTWVFDSLNSGIQPLTTPCPAV
jgi:type IV pilus assembly protein PilA